MFAGIAADARKALMRVTAPGQALDCALLDRALNITY